jgi:creatinine amidohydrolase
MRLKWGECTWEEIGEAAAQGYLVVAPFGSVEQHGPMLPLDTDVRIAERYAEEGAQLAAELYGVRSLVMPVMPYGLAAHHMRFPGTVTLQPETYLGVVGDILHSIVTHGFRKIVVISGHGGNMPGLQLAVSKVVNVYADQFPLRIALFRGHSDPAFARRSAALMQRTPKEGQPGIHAARWETAEVLADRPHLVRRERVQRPQLQRPDIPPWYWRTHELSATGAFGDPSLATAEAGVEQWRLAAEAVASLMKQLADEP